MSVSTFSFAEIIHPPHRCGISRWWLVSMIVTKFVGRKEADRVGSWRLRYVYLRQINSHRCALCVTRKHQLSRSSPRSLSVFVPTVSLWQLVRSSLHSVSLLELPFHGGFYPVSTPDYYNQTQVILILHLTHLLTAVSWVFLPLQTSLNHAPLATMIIAQVYLRLATIKGYSKMCRFTVLGGPKPLTPRAIHITW